MPAYPCVREGRALNMLSRVTAKQNVVDFFFSPSAGVCHALTLAMYMYATHLKEFK